MVTGYLRQPVTYFPNITGMNPELRCTSENIICNWHDWLAHQCDICYWKITTDEDSGSWLNLQSFAPKVCDYMIISRYIEITEENEPAIFKWLYDKNYMPFRLQLQQIQTQTQPQTQTQE